MTKDTKAVILAGGLGAQAQCLRMAVAQGGVVLERVPLTSVGQDQAALARQEALPVRR